MAMTGEVWRHLLNHDPKSALEFAKYTQVFGRCTPNDKVTIVSTFVELGEITLMCGDGKSIFQKIDRRHDALRRPSYLTDYCSLVLPDLRI